MSRYILNCDISRLGFWALVFLLSNNLLEAQQSIITNPTNWWIGMENKEVQLMLRHTEKGFNSQEISVKYDGITLNKIHRPDNDHYLFLDLTISDAAKPGKVPIKIGKSTYFWPLALKDRQGNGRTYAQGVTAKDVMYLIMPDRFSNGDPSNDRVPGMRDQSLRRDTVFNRHGGDLKGIENKLDYFNQLGVTALWLNPVLTNDMDDRTEHGYAITDHYQIDPRLGGQAAYKSLIKAAHQKGIKIIKDAVYNHVGIKHWSVQDPPMTDWLHHWPAYQQTNYREQTLMDPYASASDRKIMSDGWFVPLMPDLNHHNPHVAKFLIQHAIWCVEEFGIDGWRIDTYAYNDLDFMNVCNAALLKEYPKLSIFGETWVHGMLNQSFFTQNNLNIDYKSNQPGVTDFQLLWAINDVLTKPPGWMDGINRLYSTLANDFVYVDPYQNVIFLDNHDISRAWSVYGEHLKKYKLALSWLLTCRGIPQLYYGDEILMSGITSPNDGFVRQDFPGGWAEDKVNKFESAGRTEQENEIWNLISTLANYRKTSKALTTGKLMQFVPRDDIYVYFRYEQGETVMVVMNASDQDKVLDVSRFAERTSAYKRATNLVDKKQLSLSDKWTLKGWDCLVLVLE